MLFTTGNKKLKQPSTAKTERKKTPKIKMTLRKCFIAQLIPVHSSYHYLICSAYNPHLIKHLAFI